MIYRLDIPAKNMDVFTEWAWVLYSVEHSNEEVGGGGGCTPPPQMCKGLWHLCFLERPYRKL